MSGSVYESTLWIPLILPQSTNTTIGFYCSPTPSIVSLLTPAHYPILPYLPHPTLEYTLAHMHAHIQHSNINVVGLIPLIIMMSTDV